MEKSNNGSLVVGLRNEIGSKIQILRKNRSSSWSEIEEENSSDLSNDVSREEHDEVLSPKPIAKSSDSLL
jgi:hypothetical protein